MFQLPLRVSSSALLALVVLPGAACSPSVEAQAPAPTPIEVPGSSTNDSSVAPQRVVIDNSTAGVAQRHFKLFQEGNLEAAFV